MTYSGSYPAAALVSVVIPAHNAQSFVERTLASVLSQTHKNIEVIVVDDGSTDETASIARRFSAEDRRVRLLLQKNEGVASARNTGIRASTGAYIAPIDADDLWHPSKLETQLRVFAAGGDDLGLVYTLYRTIDAEDRVILTPKRTHPDGWVFMQHLGQNFIGNGSSVLLRRHLVFEMGGYSSRLRNSRAEGCEDFFLQLSVASRYRFGVVPEHLVGYRRTPGNMSRNFVRMLISKRIVLESFLSRCSEAVKPALLDAVFRNDVEIARIGLKRRCFATVARNSAKTFWRSPSQFVKLANAVIGIFLRKAKRGRHQEDSDGPGDRIGKTFWEYKVEEFVHSGENEDQRAVLDTLAAMDANLRLNRGYLTQPPERGTLDIPGRHTNSHQLLRIAT